MCCEAWCLDCSHFHWNPQSANVFKLFSPTGNWCDHVWLSIKLQSYWQRRREILSNSTSIFYRQTFQSSSRIHVLFAFQLLMPEQMFLRYVSKSETPAWLITQKRGKATCNQASIHFSETNMKCYTSLDLLQQTLINFDDGLAPTDNKRNFSYCTLPWWFIFAMGENWGQESKYRSANKLHFLPPTSIY